MTINEFKRWVLQHSRGMRRPIMADVPKQVRDNLLKECEQYYLINDPSKNYRMDRLEICGVEVREGEGESWAPFYKEDKSE